MYVNAEDQLAQVTGARRRLNMKYALRKLDDSLLVDSRTIVWDATEEVQSLPSRRVQDLTGTEWGADVFGRVVS